MRKVLVTGGAGFIGSNLCEALLERGDWVVCLDNFSTGHMENLIPLISRYPDSFRLIVGDTRNFDDCLRAVEGVDYVLHEAALGSVPRSVKDTVTTNEVNIGGFLNMIVAARDAQRFDPRSAGCFISAHAARHVKDHHACLNAELIRACPRNGYIARGVV